VNPDPPRITPPPGVYRLAPVPSEHVDQSRRLILAAAEAVEPRRAIVLGAGNCAEIPLAELAARFDEIVINDVDEKLLDEGLAAAHLDDAAAKKIRCHVADLTGATEPLLEKIAAAIADAAAPDAAIEAISKLVDDEAVPGARLSGTHELVVASCVLSQLHFALLHRAGDLFERRFAGELERLRASVRWTKALYDVARRMEHRFIDDLAGLVAPGGLVYLSESAQMCYIKLASDGMWETAGTYRMLHSQDIADYLDGRFTIAVRARWHWIVSPPTQPGDVGRLFDVQAVVLRT
jgi:hypothetical protein